MVPVQVYRSTAKKKLRIGSDVYIGAHSVVAEGISIGDGAILLPGTAADKDIPSYSVVYGNPAKIWEYRFSREETERLKKIRWWDYGERLLGKADFARANFDKVLEILEKEKDQITPILPMETGMKIRYKDGYCCIYSKLMDQKTLLYQSRKMDKISDSQSIPTSVCKEKETGGMKTCLSIQNFIFQQNTARGLHLPEKIQIFAMPLQRIVCWRLP